VCCYNRDMARKAEYKNPPADPTNQWVRDAMAFADNMSQSKLAEELHKRKVISAADRSVVQKMTVGRKVTAKEMLAISEITGFPTPKDALVPNLLDEIRSRHPDLAPEAVRSVLQALERDLKNGEGQEPKPD